MVALSSSVYSDSNCILLINNNTDFKSSENPNGFWIPSESGNTNPKEYYINDVYFFTYIVFNNYNGSKSNVSDVSNVGTLILWNTEDQGLTFPSLMNKYLINKQVKLSSDGYFTVYQLCIPKESIKATPRAAATNIYYVKDDGYVYSVIDTVETQINLFSLITTTTDWTTTNILKVSTDIVSKCYIDACFNSVLAQFAANYADPLCVKDNITLKSLREKRDLLFAVSNTIQYYVDLQKFYGAAKLIYDFTFCNVCREFLISNPNLDCGCYD